MNRPPVLLLALVAIGAPSLCLLLRRESPSQAAVVPHSAAPLTSPDAVRADAGETRPAQPLEAVFPDFQTWIDRYKGLPDAERKAVVAEGTALAAQRRAVMKKLIASHPQEALERAVPEAVRRALPAAVAGLLEERIDTRGTIRITARSPGENSALPSGPALRRTVLLEDGRRLKAFAYGRRENQPPLVNAPLHGIALDGKMALSEWPGRILEPVEMADAKATRAGDPLCPASGQPVSRTGTETALRTGHDVQFFCGPAHARDTLREAAEEESLHPPGFGNSVPPAVNAASGGVGQTVPSPASVGNAAWTTGAKRIGIVRVTFAGTAWQTLNVADCEAIITGCGDRWQDWSYGRCTVQPVSATGSFVTPVMDLPKTGANYHEEEVDDIWDLAVNWAQSHGRTASSYDFLIVIAGDAPLKEDVAKNGEYKTVTWSGLGRVGQGLTFCRTKTVDHSIGASLHELGHNLGLLHSSSIYTIPQQIPDEEDPTKMIPSLGAEYGDRYCQMGWGGVDYNVRYKQWLHWLEAENIPSVISPGIYTIQAHDQEESSGVRGLEIVTNTGQLLGSWRNRLVVEYRLHDPANPRYANCAQIHLSDPLAAKVWLVDATPETLNHEPNGDASGNIDSPLPRGRTYSYTGDGHKVFLTNLSANPDTGKLQLNVERDTPAGNDAPTGSILSWQTQGATGQEVFFTADASDADGDDLAYYWQISGLGPFDNEPTIGATFASAGTMQIMCTISDMHGGEVTLTFNFPVIANLAPTISAISDKVMDEDGTLANIPFTVSDPTSSASSLTVTAVASNTSLFPSSSMVIISAGGGDRRLTLTPPANRHGTSTINLRVTDGTKKAETQFTVTVQPITPGTTLIAAGSSGWKYRDADTAPPAGWNARTFDDSAWASGSARFLYSQGTLPPGATALAAPATALARATCYFRHTFNQGRFLPSGSPVLRLMCDDGAVVYLNGTEIWRQNMPGGTITHTTRATAGVGGTDEQLWRVVPLDPSRFRLNSTNTLAVEVHDAGPVHTGTLILLTGDVTFDCELKFAEAPELSAFTDRTVAEDTVAGGYTYTATEAESPSGGVTMQAFSSDHSIVLDEDIKFGTNLFTFTRFVKVTPRPNATGNVRITIRASDGSSETWRSFNLTFTPVNDPPAIASLPAVATALGEVPPAQEVSVTDVDTPLPQLTVTAVSSIAALLPNSGIKVFRGGPDGRWWLHFTPVPGMTGAVTITATVSDGQASENSAFTFSVAAPRSLTGSPVSLVRSHDQWRYFVQPLPTDGRGDPVDFTLPGFDDRAWPTGVSQLGHGESDELTTVPAQPLRVTTYFRRTFTVPDAAAFSALQLRLLRDDGAVVYLNRVEVLRSNLPATAIHPGTLASAAGNAWVTASVPAARLVSGTNVLAVEVHQVTLPGTFSQGDLSFDLELDATPAPAASGTDVIIPAGSEWAYFDYWAYPQAWQQNNFSDGDWLRGRARLGFGVSGENTVISPSESVLFRKVFDVAMPGAYSALHLFLQRDDGAVVYLNGARVLLDNVSPATALDEFSLTETPDASRLDWHHYVLSPAGLLPGRNLLAVEVHLADYFDTDCAFDLELAATLTAGQPQLFLRPVTNQMELSWPGAFNDWKLQSSGSLAPGSWAAVTDPVLLEGGWFYVQRSNAPAREFFRLTKP